MQLELAEMGLRTQDLRPRSRSRTKKKFKALAKNTNFEDIPSRGQGQDCLRPRSRTKDTTRKCSPKNKNKNVLAQKFC